jgi:hypothetical protein
MAPLTTLLERLLARAGALQIEIHERPLALRKTRMRGAALAAKEESAAPDADLPKEAESSIIGHHAILLGELGDSIAAAREQWHRFLSQAAIARSWLSAETSEDLNLYLVGPSGSDARVPWREIAAEIERDERVCRKLVWLPPATVAEQEDSLAHFLSRTFLARPWIETGAPGERDIDRLRNLGAKLTSDDAPRATIEEWLRILRTPQSDSNDLVRQLTEVLP